MHLGITEKPSIGCISCMYIPDILWKVSEQIATEDDEKLPSSTTPLSFDATSPRNPSEYLHIPSFRFFYRSRSSKILEPIEARMRLPFSPS